MTVFLSIILVLLAVSLIVIIVIQPSKGEGLGSIGGGSQMFFARNKGFERLLERATAWMAGAFILIAIIVGAIERFS